MPDLVEKKTGKSWWVPREEVADALATGLYQTPTEGTVTVVDDETGLPGDVSYSDLPRVQDQGLRPESPGEFSAREDSARIEREHGGALGVAATAAEGIIDSASFGAYGAAADYLGGEDYAKRRRERTQANPGTSLAVNIVGAAAPAILSGGAGVAGSIARATPAGAAARLGTKIAGKGGAGAKALGYGVEGALFGAGDAVSELSLSEDPVTLERAVSTISSSALLGGATGAGIGVFAKAAEKGLGKAKRIVDAQKAKRATATADDVSSIPKTIDDYQKSLDGNDVWLALDDEAKRLVTKGKKGVRTALNTPERLQKYPGRAMGALEEQRTGFKKAIANKDELIAKLDKEDAGLLKTLNTEIKALPGGADEIILSGKLGRRYGDFADVKVTKSSPAKLTREQAHSFRTAFESGEVAGARRRGIAQLEVLLAENTRVSRLVEATAEAAKASPKGVIQKAVEGTITGVGTSVLAPFMPVSAAAVMSSEAAKEIGELVFRRVGKAGAAAAKRSESAVDAFLSVGGKAAGAASKAKIPLATKVLNSASYASEANLPKAKVHKIKADTLLGSYRARESELLSQVTVTHRGLEMKPQARSAVSERLSGMRAIDALAADKVESMVARRVEFLASKLPRRPEIVSMQLGPDSWRPSDMAMRTFARYVSAVEDPGGVEERLARGAVTPEDAEAYRTVYPERFADFKRQIIERLPELRESLPYERRLALSIFTGVPVDPAMHPKVLRVLQGSYAEEEGTDGGTAPPQANPQFGSLTKPEPTRAQERAG